MSHIDCWATLAGMVGLTPPPHGAWTGNDGKPIYFDSIDNSAYILGKAKHSARRSWIYIDGESVMGARVDVVRSGQPRSQYRVEVPIDSLDLQPNYVGSAGIGNAQAQRQTELQPWVKEAYPNRRARCAVLKKRAGTRSCRRESQARRATGRP